MAEPGSLWGGQFAIRADQPGQENASGSSYNWKDEIAKCFVM